MSSALIEYDSTQRFGRMVISWLADASGDFTLMLDDLSAPRLPGRPVRLVTRPSTMTAPTDNYDITLVDLHGNDMLQGAGVDRDTATTETAWISASASIEVPLHPFNLARLEFTVANAGNGGAGLAVLYFTLDDADRL